MRFVGIDPSTKTGLVVIDDGLVVTAKEIQTKVKSDPERFIDIAVQIRKHILETDIICIEGFSYGSKGAGVSTQYGIGWLIRSELVKNGYSYYEVSPSAVKKFATGKGNVKKDAMVLPVFKHWGFEHDSDNVRDAYVLAQIAKAKSEYDYFAPSVDLTKYQIEVIKKIGGESK